MGWDRSGNPGTGGVCIHHPSGDIKKIATYTQTPVDNGNFWETYWITTSNGHSVTEGGSSGSSLINSNYKVIGQLWGGSTIYCENPAAKKSIYGKLSVSWASNDTIQRQLKHWLDPNNTGASNVIVKKVVVQ